MKEIKVERVHSKKIEYEKNGESKSFIKYAAACKGVWYELKGKGKESVKEGDTLIGEYSTQDWEAGGKSGTNHILTLIDPILSGLVASVSDLISRVKALEENAFGSSKPAEESTNDDSDGLPF